MRIKGKTTYLNDNKIYIGNDPKNERHIQREITNEEKHVKQIVEKNKITWKK